MPHSRTQHGEGRHVREWFLMQLQIKMWPLNENQMASVPLGALLKFYISIEINIV